MSALELLPDAGTSVRCAEFSREIGLDPGGTALAVDEILVADVALPWPKPVFASHDFAEVPAWTGAAAGAGRRVRVLAGVPRGDIDGARVVVHSRPYRGAPVLGRAEHRCDPGDVPALLRSLLLDGLESSPRTEMDVEAPPEEMLICTQGSHDLCCGSFGTRLVLDLDGVRPGLVVTRVSHTGGHRFAPTGMTLPDGRMWGGLAIDQLVAILDRSVPPSSVAGLCRGWTGAAAGPAQIAERAVFAVVDEWSFDTLPRQVEVVAEADGVSTVLVRCDGRRWEVEVAVGREVPTIACGEPGGLPAKPGREYRVTRIREQ